MKIETTSIHQPSAINYELRLTAFALGLLAFCAIPKAFGVSPAPDGGYSGGNTAEGQRALFGLTTGTYNTAIGVFSLESNTEGKFNTALGAATLLANTADQNTASGAGALLSNTAGGFNTATGAFALFSNTEGNDNTATGAEALESNTNGFANTADGVAALQDNTSGGGNTAAGEAALNENVTGSFNTAIGTAALLVANGDSNTAVGAGSGGNVGGANHVICIGQGVAGANVSDSCYIGSIWNQPGGPQAVYVNSDGKLGALVSSQRFKENIQSMDKRSNALFSLRPVSFRYKKKIDPRGMSEFGLLAEEVDKVNPDLVLHDKEGKPFSVRYDQVNAMLLNEFLKEHKTVQELKVTVAKQEQQISALTSGLHRVSAQIEMNKSVKTVVLNNP